MTPSSASYECPGCGGHAWLESSEIKSHSGQTYCVLRCATCATRRLDCALDSAEQESLYGEQYYSQNLSHDKSLKARVKAHMRQSRYGLVQTSYRRLSTTWLSTPMPGGDRLLDVGCGDGALMLDAAILGWRAEGCEVSEAACARARRHGFRCYGGDWALQLPRETFDFILLSHVLEHLEDPASVLATLRQALRSDGTLLVAVPNSDGALGRVFGDALQANPAPEHLWHFDSASLRGLLERAGFTVVSTRRQSAISGTLSPHVLRGQWRYCVALGWPQRRIAGAYVRLAQYYAASLLGRHRSPVGEGYGFSFECRIL